MADLIKNSSDLGVLALEIYREAAVQHLTDRAVDEKYLRQLWIDALVAAKAVMLGQDAVEIIFKQGEYAIQRRAVLESSPIAGPPGKPAGPPGKDKDKGPVGEGKIKPSKK